MMMILTMIMMTMLPYNDNICDNNVPDDDDNKNVVNDDYGACW